MNEDFHSLHDDITDPVPNNSYSNPVLDPYNNIVGPPPPPPHSPPPLPRPRPWLNSPLVIVVLVLVLLSISGIITSQYLAHTQAAPHVMPIAVRLAPQTTTAPPTPISTAITPTVSSGVPYKAIDVYDAFEQAGLVGGNYSYDGYWCPTCPYTPGGGAIAWNVNASTAAEIAIFAYPYEADADHTTLANGKGLSKYPGYVVKACLLFYHGASLPRVQDYLSVMYNMCR